MSSWLRQAGGAWVSPGGEENAVTSHGEWAYKLFLNDFISKNETPDDLVVEEKPLAGPKVTPTGDGGKEAKVKAEEQMRALGITSPLQAANKLMEDGWVRISTDGGSAMLIVMAVDYAHMMVAEEAILRAAKNVDMICVSTIGDREQLFIQPPDLQLGLAAAIEKARATANKPPVQTSGLGSWGSARMPATVEFFQNVVHKPEAAAGKQWLVLDNNGKKVAEGPSRKWAERSASRLGWFKRQQDRRK